MKATDPIIFADEMHITNVIFNLMDNAVKYKRPDVDLQLMVKTWNEPGKVMISVQDNGIGIKKENLKRYLISSIACIQVICTMLRVRTRTGLCRKIIQDHKGTIRAESELNVGTKFIIALPLLKID